MRRNCLYTGATLALATVVLLSPAAARAQKLPTEAELERKLKGPPPDQRKYQRRSTLNFKGESDSAASWVKNKLSGFHVTPDRLCLALGLIGFLYTRNKNKKHSTGWLAIYVVSILMLIGGGIGMLMKYLG